MSLQKINKLQSTLQQDALNTIPIRFPEMEAIIKLKQKYEKSVWQTVQVLEEIHIHKMPQKCFHHSNNFSLYCENDQKPLCASCVHQNQVHKAHKIIPLALCSKQIARDCKNLEKDVLLIANNLTGVVKGINDGVQKLQKQFPNILYKIQQNYKRLHHFLVEREREHFNELRYHKQKVRYQHEALSTEINKIALFIQQKVSNYSKRNDDQFLLTKRCIFEALKNSNKIINNELILQQEAQPKLNLDIFQEIEDFIYAKIPRLFSKDQRRKQMMVQNKSSKRLHSPFKEKQKDVFSFLVDTKSKPKQRTLKIDLSNSLEKKISPESKVSPTNKSITKSTTKSTTPSKRFCQNQNLYKSHLDKSAKAKSPLKQEKSKNILIIDGSSKDNSKEKERKVNYHSPISNGWKK